MAKTLNDLLDQLTPGVQKAFIDSIAQMTSEVQIRLLEEAIRQGDTATILRLVHLGSEYFAPLDQAIRAAYEAGGQFAMQELQRMAAGQGVRIRSSFGGNDPAVAEWLQQRSADRIVEITQDNEQIIRKTLARLADAGTSPRATALELVGKINRATGIREGGVVGLNSQFAEFADSAYEELINGDAHYFTRSLRDKRFDRTIAKAIREGLGLSQPEARRIVERYRNRLLYRRGENIARTELLGALNASKNEALIQMMRREGLSNGAVEQEWDASSDSATRQSHRAMDGQKRRKGEAFVTGNGNRAMYPGDPNLPADERINCRCILHVKVDFIGGLRDRLTETESLAALAAM